MVGLGMGIVLAGAVAVTAVDDGSCSGTVPLEPFADVAAAIEKAREAEEEAGRIQARTRRMLEDPTSGPCVGTEDDHRDYLEKLERDNLEKAVKEKVAEVCRQNVCASNLAYALLAWNPWIPVFGGCSNWSLVACDAIGAPAYWDKRREQRCVAPGICHFVVVLTNPRTYEEYVIDAWSYAGGWRKSGRSKGALSSTFYRFKSEFPRDSYIDNEKMGRCTIFETR